MWLAFLSIYCYYGVYLIFRINCEISMYFFQREVSNRSHIHYLDLGVRQSRNRGKECYLLPTIVKTVQCEIHTQSTCWRIGLKCLDMPVIGNTSDKYLCNNVCEIILVRGKLERLDMLFNAIIFAFCLRFANIILNIYC